MVELITEASQRAAPRWLQLVRVASVRFAALYFAPFYAALEATGHGSIGWVIAGAAFCWLLCLGIELLNRVTDWREDTENNPSRTAMCHAVSYFDIGVVSVLIFLVLIPMGFAWLITWGNVQLFLVQTVIWFVAWNYSFGLRFKARRYFSLCVLGATFLLPFLCGFSMYGSLLELPPMLLYPLVFAASIAGAKDITDVKGDLQRGYRSFFVDLIRPGAGTKLFLLLGAPHALLLALVALGQAPLRCLWLLLLLPLSALFGTLVRAAHTAEERRSVREFAYHLWMLMVLTTLGLLYPTPRLLAVLGGTLAFWAVATRRLHWHVGLDRAQADKLGGVLRRALFARWPFARSSSSRNPGF